MCAWIYIVPCLHHLISSHENLSRHMVWLIFMFYERRDWGLGTCPVRQSSRWPQQSETFPLWSMLVWKTTYSEPRAVPCLALCLSLSLCKPHSLCCSPLILWAKHTKYNLKDFSFIKLWLIDCKLNVATADSPLILTNSKGDCKFKLNRLYPTRTRKTWTGAVA